MSKRFACRGIPGRLAGLIVLATLTGSIAGAPAAGEVLRFFGVSGQYSVSVDAGGTVFGSHTITVEKPSDEATVFVAFVFAASHSFRVIADGDVSIDGVPISWSGAALTVLPNQPGVFYNVLGNVTDVVADKIAAADPGPVSFRFEELGGTTIDGEILAVVFADPKQADERTVWLAFGGSTAEVDTFVVSLKEAIDPGLPGALADFGLGISASSSFQGLPAGRNVLVDNVRLTSAAGGEDDGGRTPGSRITVGGVGDSRSNPPDPEARPELDPRYDDELYGLLPFFSPSQTRYEVTTLPGQGGSDNLFFAYFVFSEFAVIDAGVFLDPETATHEVGSETTLTATAFDSQGEPAGDVEVTFEVVDGPNAGVTGTVATDGDGVATFTYTGAGGAGVDAIEASIDVVFHNQLTTVRSNHVSHEWIAAPTLAVVLEPQDQTVDLGGSATLAAGVTVDGAPAPGVTVGFLVLEGPNTGVAGSAVTDDEGVAFFVYDGLGGLGIDLVEASVTDGSGPPVTALQTVNWTVALLAEPRPDVAADDDGNILVVREAGEGLFSVLADVLTADGTFTASFTVNDKAGVHRSPAAAALAEGGFAVVFAAGRDALLGRLVDAGGPLGDVFTIAVAGPGCDASEGCAPSRPDVAARPGGGFAVVWEQEGSILGRLYGVGGTAEGAAFTVATGAAESPRLEPAVAVLADGSLAVAYTAVDVESGEIPLVLDEIRLARFDDAGGFLADVAASRFSGGRQGDPAVAAAGDRPFVFWESFSDDTGAGIFGRLDPEDAARPELQVNTVIAGDQLRPAAAVEASGLVAVVWLNAPRNRLAAQRLAPGLAYVDGELTIEPALLLGVAGGVPEFGRPRVASLADGTLVVAAAVAGSATDPDGGVAVGFLDPSPLADCFEDGRLICLKVAVEP